MRIVVLDGYTLNPGDNPWDSLARLGELTIHDYTPEDQIVKQAAGYEILVTNKAPVSAQTIAQLPNLKLIVVTATGYNIVDVQAAANRNIPVCNIPEYGTDSVAQFTFALLMELCHHVGLHDSAVKDGEWTRSRNFSFWKTPLIELVGKTMGVVGFGRIGQRVGELATAFKMKVIFNARSNSSDPRARSVNELFSESDVISLHCPLTDQTRGMVNAKLLSRMKPSGLLINTSRGGLVNEHDLASVLNAGSITGAAVDVVSEEPIRASNPLLKAKNIIITPHNAWAALEPRQRVMRTTEQIVSSFLAGKPINVVNKVTV
ncbi:MAG TPA: D-2-hydroxyacid dehydrogenase [Tepidisphaeraceae bacterium]|nr:D-2-hydroxyacid dehydrogenase [Tepidisphaeraceae bacterium]